MAKFDLFAAFHLFNLILFIIKRKRKKKKTMCVCVCLVWSVEHCSVCMCGFLYTCVFVQVCICVHVSWQKIVSKDISIYCFSSGGRRTPSSSKNTTPISLSRLTKPPSAGSRGKDYSLLFRSFTRFIRISLEFFL